MKFTKTHHDLLIALGSEKWALSTDDSVREKWRNLLIAIEEPEKDCSEASDMIYSDIHQVLVDIATEQGMRKVKSFISVVI